MKKTTQLNWVRYYRNSLADGEMYDIRTKDCKNGYYFDSFSDLTSRKLKEIYNKFKDKPKKKSDTEEEENQYPIDVFISPLYIDSKFSHGQKSDNYKTIYPFWIPLKLNQNGGFQISSDDNNYPWFMRSVLEPVETDSDYYPIISSVNKVDQVSNSFNFQFDSWENYWDSTKKFFKEVIGDEYSDFKLEGYNTVNKICLIKGKNIVSAQNILRVYDDVLKKSEIPPLMNKVLTISNDNKRSTIPKNDDLFLSKGHYAQYNNQFPLSTTQRQSLLIFEKGDSGEILAVNGPPGTGKTTLIQSIVANEMVKAAIKGDVPPMIVASSTNNQAITNILDSFRSGGSIKRWVPYINSLGSYLISSDTVKQTEALKKGYQILTQNNFLLDGFYFTDICNLDSDEIEKYFMDRYIESYPKNKNFTLEDAVYFLKNKILKQADRIDFILEVISKYFKAEAKHSQFTNLYDFKEEIREQENVLNFEIELSEKLIKFKDSYALFADKNRSLHTFSFINSLQKRYQRELSLFLISSPSPELKTQTTNKEVELTLISSIRENDNKIAHLQNEIKTKNALYEELSKIKNDFDTVDQDIKELRNEYLRGKKPQEIAELEKEYNQLHYTEQANQTLDTSIRYQIFFDTIHYWEGQWIIQQRKKTFEQNRGATSRVNTLTQISFLTPLTISTFHSLPGFCSYSEKTTDTWIRTPLYELFDLLIVDEAGQVSPEVGTASFALAKRALVVGDVHQIEPIWSISFDKIDTGNLKDNSLLEELSFQELKKLGVLCSSGSLMHLARNGSNYEVNSRMGGIILTEHRRCVDELVEFCNEFVYENLLIPKVGKLKEEDSQIKYNDTVLNLPPLSYINVRGDSKTQNGGSLYNEIEAQAIAKWIFHYSKAIVDHFNKGKAKNKESQLKDCIAIITPFAQQKKEIYKWFNEYGIDNQITVGTVHSLQGAERPLVIFSPTYGTNHNGQLFFDSGYNMLNVALTRAKKHFVVIGNMALFNSKKRNIPSGGLAKYLFANEQNELPSYFLFDDVAVNVQTRIDSVEKHQKCIDRVCLIAKERVIIVSPFISINAITSDSIAKKIKDCVNRNVKVTIYTDEFLDKPRGALKKSSTEGRQTLIEAGAELITLPGIHNKAIVKDEDLLIEGSFNWLSATRDPNSPHYRFDVSHIIQNSEAKKNIKQLLDEMKLIESKS